MIDGTSLWKENCLMTKARTALVTPQGEKGKIMVVNKDLLLMLIYGESFEGCYTAEDVNNLIDFLENNTKMPNVEIKDYEEGYFPYYDG